MSRHIKTIKNPIYKSMRYRKNGTGILMNEHATSTKIYQPRWNVKVYSQS